MRDDDDDCTSIRMFSNLDECTEHVVVEFFDVDNHTKDVMTLWLFRGIGLC